MKTYHVSYDYCDRKWNVVEKTNGILTNVMHEGFDTAVEARRARIALEGGAQ